MMGDGRRLLCLCNKFRMLVQSLFDSVARLHDFDITHGDLCMYNVGLKEQHYRFLIDGECALDEKGKRYLPIL